MELATRLPVPIRRWGYRLAHAILRVYWFLCRPEAHGVKCVLTDGERILLVRHTYGRSVWELPGGRIESGEAPAATAAREMREELGISIDDWTPLGRVTGRAEFRRDTLHCFTAPVGDHALAVDGGEIESAEWFPRQALPPDLGGYVPRVLALRPEGNVSRE
jgi:8-oxo-dGTP pyrophosphatase MutT (NUDIX family)